MKLDRTSMLYATLVLTGTSLASQLLGFLYRILLSRLIGAEIMGLYQLIMPVYSVVMSITAVGLTVAMSNLSSEYHALGNRLAIAQVLRRCLAAFLILFSLVAAVTALLYDPISVYLLGDARTQLGLLLLLPCILLSGAVTPVINMPMFLQHGSQLNPIRHFTTLVQGVFLRDITFEAASVSLLKICAITVVCVCVEVWMCRRRG